MAKRTFQYTTFTPTVNADNAAMSTLTYMGIEAISATTGLQVIEIYEGGQAPASSINTMVFARSGTAATSPVALSSPASDGPMNSLYLSLGSTAFTYISASTGPFRSSALTAARLNLSFNSFGGIVRWVAAPGEEWGIIGTALPQSASTLSGAITGGGLMGAHIIYEPYIWFLAVLSAAALAGVLDIIPGA